MQLSARGIIIPIPPALIEMSSVIRTWLDAHSKERGIDDENKDECVFHLDFDPVDVYAFLGIGIGSVLSKDFSARKRIGDFFLIENRYAFEICCMLYVESRVGQCVCVYE